MSQSDKKLNEFIKTQGEYIPISDLKNSADKSIAEFYEITDNYLKTKNDSIINYYTLTEYIECEGNRIMVGMWHIDGFKKLIKLKEEYESQGKNFNGISGNVSGKDFAMEIDLEMNKILSTLGWQ